MIQCSLCGHSFERTDANVRQYPGETSEPPECEIHCPGCFRWQFEDLFVYVNEGRHLTDEEEAVLDDLDRKWDDDERREADECEMDVRTYRMRKYGQPGASVKRARS